jgi:hypothetical protein
MKIGVYLEAPRQEPPVPLADGVLGQPQLVRDPVLVWPAAHPKIRS